MLTQSENETLTRVGPGTPAGEMLRRYWHVAAAAVELTEEKPVKPVRLLGEEMVLFRMPPGPGGSHVRYGLVGERCPHRLTSFKFGLVDCEGIRCIYHGWKFAPDGACLEQPAEDPESTFKDRIRHRAYPVKKFAGLLFAYLGPLPAPELPRWDVLAREDGRRWGVIESMIDCNWLQAMENSVDPTHLYWLHGSLGTAGLPAGPERFAALGLQTQFEEKHEFTQFEYGIMKRRITPNPTPGAPPEVEQHPLVFPTYLRLVPSMASVRTHKNAGTITPEESKLRYVHDMDFRTPVDDTHTMEYRVVFLPSSTHMSADEDPPFEVCPFKDEAGNYRLQFIPAQDMMAWEAQGGVVDRTQEHLAASDRGLTMLRKLVREQIEVVRNGGDPIGVIRDPAKNVRIDFDVVHEPLGLYRSAEAVGS
jgi:5,5'-dehydrodivanillate O-demethylase oxygenase subunit